MASPEDLESRYLRALAKLSSSLGHSARNELHNMTIQIDLALEILRHHDPGEQETRTRLERAATLSRRAGRDVEEAIERILKVSRPSTSDLGNMVAMVGELLGPLLRSRLASLELEVPAHPVWFEGDHERLRRALLMAAVEAADKVAERGRLALRLDADGALTLQSSPADAWLPGVRDTIASAGFEVNGHADQDSMVLRLPVQSGAR